MVANEPDEFANACVKLYQEEPAWAHAQSMGFKIVRELFDGVKNQAALLQAIDHPGPRPAVLPYWSRFHMPRNDSVARVSCSRACS